MNTFSLITNLLNWSRSQREILKLNPTLVNLTNLIDEVISFHDHPAISKQIQIDTSNVAQTEINIDKDCLFTILLNLLSNAIKFTNEQGTIKFSTVESDNYVTIQITDNGKGIAPQRLEHLFDMNCNDSTSGTHNEKGTGLGLIICKELVEKSGGKISVESEENKETTFSIELPR